MPLLSPTYVSSATELLAMPELLRRFKEAVR